MIIHAGAAGAEVAWLIRHGQSHANAGAATDHPRTIPLTPLGREQASALADSIDAVPDRVVVSPFMRTLDTARPFIAKLHDQGREVSVVEWPIQEFTYLSPIRCKGTTAADRKIWADEYWTRADPNWRDGDGAESYSELMQRVDDFSDRLSGQSGLTIVFGHGMFFKAFLIGLRLGTARDGIAMTRYRRLESAAPLRNAQIVRVTRSNDDRLSAFGDSDHGP